MLLTPPVCGCAGTLSLLSQAAELLLAEPHGEERSSLLGYTLVDRWSLAQNLAGTFSSSSILSTISSSRYTSWDQLCSAAREVPAMAQLLHWQLLKARPPPVWAAGPTRHLAAMAQVLQQLVEAAAGCWWGQPLPSSDPERQQQQQSQEGSKQQAAAPAAADEQEEGAHACSAHAAAPQRLGTVFSATARARVSALNAVSGD